MPAAGLEVGGFDLAEGDKQHSEDERGLQYTDDFIDGMTGTPEAGDAGVDEVEDYTQKHGDGQCPVLVEAEEEA